MKTLFVSISTKNVSRNFANLPNSVLDLLSFEKNLKVVLLLKNNTDENIKKKFAQAKNLIIEEFTENSKKNLIQRFFHFCYSYLILTDTTKLVSSYGVRADKPRPFVKVYNYPLKWFIACVLGRSRWVRQVLAPKLYFKIFSKRPYRYLFDRHHPDLVFLPNICIWPCDLEFLAEAKRQKVKTVGMPANWDHLSKYYIPFRVDKLLVWSGPVRKEAISYQDYFKEDVEIVGAPVVDFFLKKENLSPREEFLKNIGFSTDSQVIMFASQGPYSLDGPDIVEMILDWITKRKLPSNLKLIIRPHPNAIGEERYNKFVGDSRVYLDRLDSWSSVSNVKNYINVLYHSDVVITTYSTLVTESTLFDTPSIIANFDGYKNRPLYQSVRRLRKFTHFQCVLATHGVKVADSPSDLLLITQNYLTNPSEDQAERDFLKKETFGYLDGKNVSRTKDAILKLLA